MKHIKNTLLFILLSVYVNAQVNNTSLESYLNYTTSQGTNISEDYIKHVQFNNLDNDTSNSTISGYSDFSSLIVTVEKNTSPTINITKFLANTNNDNGLAVWIDFNQDGDFKDKDERVLFSVNKDSQIKANIYIPNHAKLGATRMRISMKNGALPKSTETFTYGEVEDYTINIKEKESKLAFTDLTKIEVYPNPFSKKITIHFGKQLNHFSVILQDLSGRIIYQSLNTDNSTNTLFIDNLQDLSSGTYLLKIMDFESSQSITKKLIK